MKIRSYSERLLEEASRDYGDIEKKIADGEPLQTVLVSAGSIEQLRRAYPNFFLDTKAFVSQIDRIEKQNPI